MFYLLRLFAVKVFLYNDVSKLRKRRIIEANAECRHLTKFTCKVTLREVYNVYLSEAENPMPPPLHTVYVYTVYLFTQGGGGGHLNQREGANVHKARSKIPL
jgi:hypothetical protein